MPDVKLNLWSSENTKPHSNSAATIRNMLVGEGTFATTLLVWFIDTFFWEKDANGQKVETGCLDWHPETIIDEIERVTSVRLPKRNFDRLMAAITIVNTDLFFKSVDRFIPLTKILAGDDDFTPEAFEPATVADCAWGITEALLLVPPDQRDPEPFSDEVRHYVGFALKEEGFISPPDILRIALDADWQSQVTYNFSDDPVMFQGITKMQLGKKDEVVGVIRDGIRTLLEQLKTLPLQEGKTAEIEARLRQALGTGKEKR